MVYNVGTKEREVNEMTNKQIILLESVKLMEDGILKPTDEKIIVEYEGEKKRAANP